MTWKTERVHQGWTRENGREVPLYGIEAAPDKDDLVNKNTLDIGEAAAYISILEDTMRQVLTVVQGVRQGWYLNSNTDEALSRAHDELIEVLATDAWRLVKSRRKKEQTNG